MLASQGHTAAAVTYYEQALSIHSDDVVALVNLGNALDRLGAPDRAIEQYGRAIDAEPGNAVAYFNRGVTCEESKGETEHALADYRMAVSLDPGYADAHFGMARIHWRRGEPSLARRAFEPGLHFAPGDPEALQALRSLVRHWNVRAGQKVGVVGLGGLGHMGVKLANAFGARVVVFTTSPGKADDAVRPGAHEVVISSDPAALQKQGVSFDFLLDTVCRPPTI